MQKSRQSTTVLILLWNYLMIFTLLERLRITEWISKYFRCRVCKDEKEQQHWNWYDRYGNGAVNYKLGICSRSSSEPWCDLKENEIRFKECSSKVLPADVTLNWLKTREIAARQINKEGIWRAWLCAPFKIAQISGRTDQMLKRFNAINGIITTMGLIASFC